jgi:hypothetical protein
VFKDKDPVNAFAVNPFDQNIVVLATSRGIKEIRLDEELNNTM